MELLLGTCVVNAAILYNMKLSESGQTTVSMTYFREKLCEQLLNAQRTAVGDLPMPVEPVDNSVVHNLQETDEHETGKRADRRKRRYCVGCYNSVRDQAGRDVGKKRAKRVTTECVGCHAAWNLCC